MSDLLPEDLEPITQMEEEANDLAFLDEMEDDIPQGYENLVKLRTSSGSPIFIPVDGPVTVDELLEIQQLRPTIGTVFWVGGVSVDSATFEVGPGAEVVVVGSVKGA